MSSQDANVVLSLETYRETFVLNWPQLAPESA